MTQSGVAAAIAEIHDEPDDQADDEAYPGHKRPPGHQQQADDEEHDARAGEMGGRRAGRTWHFRLDQRNR